MSFGSFFGKAKAMFSQAKSFIGGTIKKIPAGIQKAKTLVPKIKGSIARVKAIIDLLPDNVKGPILSGISSVESQIPNVEQKVDSLSKVANSDALGGGGQAAQAEQGAPEAAA